MFIQNASAPNLQRTRSIRWFLTAILMVWLSHFANSAAAQKTPNPAKLRNILPLPSTVDRVSQSKSNATKSLPKVKQFGRLTSALTVAEEDLLLEDESNVRKTDEDAGWEKVTPVPVKPSENPNSDWLKQRGESLPRRREIYPLEEEPNDNVPITPEPQNEAPVPAGPYEENELEEQDDAPMYSEVDDMAPSPSFVPPLNHDSVEPHASQDVEPFSYPEPRMRSWPEVEGLSNSLAHQLNNAELYPSVSYSKPNTNNHSTSSHHFSRLRHRVDQQLQCSVPVPQPAVLNESCLPSNFVPQTLQEGYHPEDFAPTMVYDLPPNPAQELESYYGKKCVPTPRPPIELFRPFYGDGIFSPAIPIFSDVNPLMPQFLVYGDYRAGVGIHRDALGNNQRSIANRLNIDMDLRLTGTERFHAFMAPLDNNGQSTRLDFNNSRDVRFETEMDAQLETGFFEGDLGAMYGGLTGQDAPFDLPIAVGLMPMIFQNGIWMEDIVGGVAISLPWRHSQALNWNNYDMTFFALFDQITTPAFANNNGVGSAFGTAWFIEAYEGYIEADYAYMLNRVEDDFSYHNVALAYTRRYFQFLSNSVRVINNVGQNFDAADRTADGTLLLVENAFRTSKATTVIPYANFFYGLRRTQSAARAGVAGGILRNTGIMFESDNLTNYPTLDATGNGTYGGALGINLFASDFRQQFVFEFAALDSHGDDVFNNINGAEYGFGGRYQRALNNWSLLRLDAMVGMRDDAPDLYGSRAEWRRKF